MKKNFMINTTPIGSQSSLNVRGSRRTHDLAEKLLNCFTIQSRVKLRSPPLSTSLSPPISSAIDRPSPPISAVDRPSPPISSAGSRRWQRRSLGGMEIDQVALGIILRANGQTTAARHRVMVVGPGLHPSLQRQVERGRRRGAVDRVNDLFLSGIRGFSHILCPGFVEGDTASINLYLDRCNQF